QAEDGIRDKLVTGVQTCALPICVTALPSLGLDSLWWTSSVRRRIERKTSGVRRRFAPSARRLATANSNRCRGRRFAGLASGRARSEERRVGKEWGGRGWRGE